MEKELDQLEEKEQYDVKYMAELREYWNSYMYALINEIYVGVGVNLGLSEKEAYRLAKGRPGTLQKATFFKSIFDKFKNIFSYKIPKFRYKKKIFGDGKPMSPQQWEKFNDSLSKYWREHALKVAEDMGLKSYMLGRETTEFREKKKPYQKKSLFQVANDQFDGSMPDNISEAYKKYDFKNSEKKVIEKSQSNIAMYVTQTDNNLQEAIRQQVQIGMNNNLSPAEIASNLYWEVEKNENLNNKYTAESLRKNWNRISTTEMASAYESAVLAPYEEQAMESMDNPEKAQYFVRTGGSCDWCRPRQGTVVRLVPAEIVTDTQNESLRSMGIKDPNTDIAIWNGKNNIGLKKADWMICCPAHPYNTATFQPIDLKSEWYNPKTGDIERRKEKDKLMPQQKDYNYRSPEEKEDRKPHYISSNRVQFNGNIYEAVSPDEYNRKQEEWKKDNSLPIPVNSSSPSYRRIFGEAEKYG